MRDYLSIIALTLAAPALAGVPSKEALLSAWESNWTTINDLSLTWNTACETPGAVPAYTSRLRTNGLQYLIRMERYPEGALILEEVSFDPSTGLARFLNDGPASLRPRGWISTAETPVGNRAQYSGEFLTRMLRPLETTNGWELHSLSHMLADSASQVRPDLETVDGRPAAVLDVYLDGARTRAVWLDIERNAVPLKWREYRAPDILLGTHVLYDYQEYNGAFLPLRIETFWGADSPFGPTTSQLQVPIGESGPLIAINSGLTAEDCTVSFPPGTQLMNEVKSEMTVVRGDGRALEMAYASVRGPQHSNAVSPVALGLAAVCSLFSGLGLRFALKRGPGAGGNGWNQTKAAQALGISRDSLRYRLRNYEIRRREGN